MKILNGLLRLLVLAVFAVGSGSLLAAGGNGGGGDGGGGHSRDALSADFLPMFPTKGKGYAQYFPFSGGDSTTLNADVRLALEKLVDDGDNIILNTHLGITADNADEVAITIFIGTDEDGDGSCLTEGPTSICVLFGGGGDDLVNEDGILHAAYAMSLIDDEGHLKGSGICWSNFEKTKVVPQVDEDGNMTSVVFEIEGGVEAMPAIANGDGTMVGFGAPWLFDDKVLDCGADATCEVIPIMMGGWTN
jgi:hypothetical protein